MGCFFDKTNGLDDWIILDLGACGIYLIIIVILVLLKKSFVKIKKCIIDCKNNYYHLVMPTSYLINKNTFSPSLSPPKNLSDKFEKESLETEEINPLLMI